MKKTINLFVYLVVLLFPLIFAFVACGKETTIKETVTPVSDTVTKTDTMPATDTITSPPITDTTSIPFGNIKLLALGDSYTIGQNVEESARFPAQTVQLLQGQNITTGELQYIAQTGWTTGDLISAISQQKPANDFDIVTLLIGVNNQYQGGEKTAYANQFKELLNKAIAFAGQRKSRVFVLSIPDYSVTPFVSASEKDRVSKEIDEFNAINKKVTEEYHITYLDITTSTRQATNDASLITNDSLHPSGKEYRKWAEMLAPLIKNVLK